MLIELPKRIVHIWNICGIGGLLARNLDNTFPHYYESVAVDRGHANRYGHNNEKTLVWENRAAVWLIKCALFARDFDIIHVHSGAQWLKYYRMLYPKKIIVLHAHGTKFRSAWNKWESDLKNCDQVIVSTAELLEGSPEGTMYLPNPVDELKIEKVKEYQECEPIPEAFHLDVYALDKAAEYAKENDLKLNVFDRNKDPLSHEHFLRLLQRYEYYIDVKREYPGFKNEGKVLRAFSMTGLEALALGCKVIDWKGDIHKELPLEHQGFMVAARLCGIYDKLLNPRRIKK
jgi:glycosyltransferase involved in cell wall biosynthesis